MAPNSSNSQPTSFDIESQKLLLHNHQDDNNNDTSNNNDNINANDEHDANNNNNNNVGTNNKELLSSRNAVSRATSSSSSIIMNRQEETKALLLSQSHHNPTTTTATTNEESSSSSPSKPQIQSQQLSAIATSKTTTTDLFKLIFGAGGIYASFLYYGSLQEDVFRYEASTDGEKFTQAWFLQFIEALANIIIGYIGMMYSGRTINVPLKMFAISGCSQVFAKTCTSLALANGLSFPVATLAKSAKMAPVMVGSLLLGGVSYTIREYIQVVAIIGGTAIVNFGGHKKSNGTNSTMLGLLYIIGSLTFDGITAGFQKRLQVETTKINCKPKPYDYMFWTNFFMCFTAFAAAIITGEIYTGFVFCIENKSIFSKIMQFAACSAIGQSFIFYTLANFDPLVLSTVTTTRKIFSVLLSILLKGHALSMTGWMGVSMACAGIASELVSSSTKHGNTKKKKASV